MTEFWHAFFEDTRTQVLLLLIAIDLVLGLAAAFVSKYQQFNLSYVADFARNDIMGKVLPFIVLYLGYKYAKGADIVIPGVDMEVVMNAAWIVVLAALIGSFLKSLKDLGIPITIPQIAEKDPNNKIV